MLTSALTFHHPLFFDIILGNFSDHVDDLFNTWPLSSFHCHLHQLSPLHFSHVLSQSHFRRHQALLLHLQNTNSNLQTNSNLYLLLIQLVPSQLFSDLIGFFNELICLLFLNPSPVFFLFFPHYQAKLTLFLSFQ